MGLRSLLTRIGDTRSGETTDPLGLGDTAIDERLDHIEAEQDRQDVEVEWLDAIAPADDEDTDPGGADLASPEPEPDELPAGAVRNMQNVYEEGRRCATCGVPSIGETCVKCVLGVAS
jgi:hypothetical protein